MQQEAPKALNFSTQKTMRLAQQLYEGVEVKGHGTIGLITYLRTDSTRIAEEADAAARAFVKEHYGENYMAAGEPAKRMRERSRMLMRLSALPIYPFTPVMVKESLPRDLFRLYQLIWKRFCCQPHGSGRMETTMVKSGEETSCSVQLRPGCPFDGFMSVYVDADDEEEKGQTMGAMEKGSASGKKLEPSQHFTQPPAHYTEASLCKGAGGAGDRTSQYLCAHHYYHYCQTLCCKGK